LLGVVIVSLLEDTFCRPYTNYDTYWI